MSLDRWHPGILPSSPGFLVLLSRVGGVLCLLPSWLPLLSWWNVPFSGLLVNRVHGR